MSSIFLSKTFSISLALSFSLSPSFGYAFSDVEAQNAITECMTKTQKQYGHNAQVSQAYCHCQIWRTVAYMKKHNLKQDVKKPSGKKNEIIARDFINIAKQCVREHIK